MSQIMLGLTVVMGLSSLSLHETSSTCRSNGEQPQVGVCVQEPPAISSDPSVLTVEACCALCSATTTCGQWVLRVNTTLHPGCFLKPAGKPTLRKDPLCTSGTVTPSPPSPPVPPTPPLPIPSSLRAPPTYWCTWLAQSREWMDTAGDMTTEEAEDFWMKWRNHDPVSPVQGYSGWDAFSNQSFAFETIDRGGKRGVRPSWGSFFPRSRQDMMMMFDNGWAEADNDVLVSQKKFPMFCNSSNGSSGPTPPLTALQRLKRMSDHVIAEGWRGMGVWIPGSNAASNENLVMLQAAGVRLLKVDGGDAACDVTQRARVYAPDLYIEHGLCEAPSCPLNGNITQPGGRWPWASARAQSKTLNCTDLFRTYDMVKALSVSEVLDRQYKLLNVSSSFPIANVQRRFGGSGEHMVTASLGGVIQPMIGDVAGVLINPAFEVYVEGPPGRQRQHRSDEVDRLNNWARIAPPFGAGTQPTGKPDVIVADESEVLWDSWTFKLCDDACTLHKNIVNKTVFQGAPARVSRGGLSLPLVTVSTMNHNDTTTSKPFVVLTQFPNGPIMLTALGRTSHTSGWVEPRTNVSVDLSNVNTNNTKATTPTNITTTTTTNNNNDNNNNNNNTTSFMSSDHGSHFPPIAMFGRFDNVEVVLSAVVFNRVTHAQAADLVFPNTTVDISSQLQRNTARSSITIAGSLIDTIGCRWNTQESAAVPGLLLLLSLS